MTRLLASLLCMVLLVGCKPERLGDCFTGRGRTSAEHRNLPLFTALVLEDKVDVVLAQDTTLTLPVVVVRAGHKVIPHIRTVVEDGALHISDRMRCHWVRDMRERPVVHITLPRLERIMNHGLGDVESITPIRGDRFALEQWDGHGTIRLELEVRYVQVELHTGVGDAVLSGTTQHAYYYTSTLGRIDARALRAEEVQLNNSGTCDMHCHATAALRADIRARGDVYYAGQPALVESTITGQGRLIAL